MKFDIEKNKKIIIIVLIILFILFVIVRLLVNASKSKEKDTVNVSNTSEVTNTTNTTNTTKNEARIKKLKKASEAERIRTYLGEYFRFVENKDYESAYKLLYADFKQNYFPTIGKYIDYIEECRYPKMLAIDYKNIQTQGYYYIVTLDITNMDPNAINSEAVVKEDTKFVIKEDDYDEFYLSFQL